MSPPSHHCVICGMDGIKNTPEGNGFRRINCKRCGIFLISEEALEDLPLNKRFGSLDSRIRANISGWLRQNSGIRITNDDFQYLLNLKTPSLTERADRLLIALSEQTGFIGQQIEISDKEFLSWGWCINEKEFAHFLSFLKEPGYIGGGGSATNGIRKLSITTSGWLRLEQLKHGNPDSQQGFVAMWFHKDMRSVYDNALAYAIAAAGYNPTRVDDSEHEGKIDDRIIAEIRRSLFVVADYTGHRGGVYYEAGFAHGLNLRVFFTCRKDSIDDLHFDVRQYNCIDWKTEEELRVRLTSRIEAVLGRGKLSS